MCFIEPKLHLKNVNYNKKDKKQDLIIILCLLLLNIIIKSLYLGDYNIELDEPFTIYHAQSSLVDLFKMFHNENNPPLFFILMHFWVKMFGIGIISVRILPMLFSSAAVIFIYMIAKKYINIIAALGASLFYTFSIIGIMLAHDARVYSLFVLLTTASMYFYFLLINAEKKKKYFIVLTIINVLLIYAHFLAFFVILIQIIYTLIFSSIRKDILKKYAVSLLVLFIAYLPYLFIFLKRISATMHTGLCVPKSSAANPFTILNTCFNYNTYVTILFLVILVLFGLTVLFKKKRLNVYDLMIAGWFIIPSVFMFIISLRFPLTIATYMSFTFPGFYILIMLGTTYLTSNFKMIGIFIISAGLFLMIINTDLNYSYKFESSKAVSLIHKLKTDSTRVYIFPSWIELIFAYHYNIEAFKDFGNFKQDLAKDHVFIISSANDIDTVNTNISEVLLFHGWSAFTNDDKDHSLMNALVKKFGPMDTIANYNSYEIYRFCPKRQ